MWPMYIIDRGHSPKARSARSHIIAFFWTDTPSKLSLGYYYVMTECSLTMLWLNFRSQQAANR